MGRAGQVAIGLLLLVLLLSNIPVNSIAGTLEADVTLKKVKELQRKGDVQQSIELLKSLLKQQPGRSRTHLELASAYYQTEQFRYAQHHLGLVLKDKRLPERVRLYANQLKAQIHRKTKKKKTSSVRRDTKGELSISAGGQSSNFDKAFDLFQDNDDTSEAYLRLKAKVSHRTSLPPFFERGGVLPSLRSEFGVSVFQDNDKLRQISLGTRLRAPISPQYYFGLGARFEHIHILDSRLGEIVSLQPSFSAELDQFSVRIAAYFGQRQFNDDRFSGYDGPDKRVSVAVGFEPANRQKIELGLRFRRYDAERATRGFDNVRAWAKYNAQLGSRYSMTLSASVGDYQYHGLLSNALATREDRKTRVAASLDYQIAPNLRGGTRLFFEERRSNLDQYDREQSGGELFLKYEF